MPGGAVAGRVDGRRVVAHTGQRGGYAERVAVPAAALSDVPGGVSLPDAAALLHDGPTAVTIADGTRIGPGDRVLVVGASGGLGILLLQLARARGAERVVATGRDPAKLARIRELGADAVVDTDAGGWPEAAGEAEVVLDNIGGAVGEAAFGLVARGGRFSGHGTPSGRFAAIDPAAARDRGVELRGIADVQLSPAELKRATETALGEAAAGRIRPVIGQTYPLAQAAEAHAAIEARSVFGKTLLVT